MEISGRVVTVMFDFDGITAAAFVALRVRRVEQGVVGEAQVRLPVEAEAASGFLELDLQDVRSAGQRAAGADAGHAERNLVVFDFLLVVGVAEPEGPLEGVVHLPVKLAEEGV